MTEIPEDVMKAADEAYGDAVRGGHDTRSYESRIIVIARAILAERERCAKICDSRMYDFGCISGVEAQDYVTICADLACEIRK